MAFFAVAAAAAGDVERHRAQVADLDEFHIGADLDDFAGDFVAQHQPCRCCGAAPDHVLIGAADVGGDTLQDGAVGHLAADVGRVHPRPVPQFQGRVVGVVDLDLAGPHICNRFVARHRLSSSTSSFIADRPSPTRWHPPRRPCGRSPRCCRSPRSHPPPHRRRPATESRPGK